MVIKSEPGTRKEIAGVGSKSSDPIIIDQIAATPHGIAQISVPPNTTVYTPATATVHAPGNATAHPANATMNTVNPTTHPANATALPPNSAAYTPANATVYTPPNTTAYGIVYQQKTQVIVIYHLWSAMHHFNTSFVFVLMLVHGICILVFGSFGLSTKEPYTIMLCPLSLAVAAAVSVHTSP